MDDMKIVDMARTPAEKKEAKEAMTSPMATEEYPWGLCLHLGKEELEKLGITELPDVGDEFHIYAVCEVRSVSQNKRAEGEDSKSIELQVTHMGAMHEDEAEEKGDAFSKAAKKLYGAAETAEGE